MKRLILTFAVVAMTVPFLATDAEAQRRGRRGKQKDENALTVGEMAPDFTLKSLDGDTQTELASFRGEKPVILFFGSYT